MSQNEPTSSALCVAPRSALREVIDREWRKSASNFGGGSWLLFLKCGHVEWRKESVGSQSRVLCYECKMGRTKHDPEWDAKFPPNTEVSHMAATPNHEE